MAKIKQCAKCAKTIDERFYLKTNSPWFPDGRSNICTECLEGMLQSDDMVAVDSLCRWLDYPFLIDEWTKLFLVNKGQTLRVYSQMYFGGAYEGLNWDIMNKKIRTAIENGTLEKKVSILRDEWRKEMQQKWQGTYTDDEFEHLEYLHMDILRTQNVVTAIQKNWALVWCKKALQIDKDIHADVSTKDAIKECNDIIKAAGFEPKNAKNIGDFDSAGELISYLIKKGYKQQFYDGKDRDLVDLTIKDTQAFLRRLVNGEPGLADQVQQRKDSYAISKHLDEDDEAKFASYEQSGFNVEFEDEFEVEEPGCEKS
jgi:hypothetical protein